MILDSVYRAVIEILLAYWKQIEAPKCRCQNHNLLISAVLGSYSSDDDYAFHCSSTATLTQPCTLEVVPRLDGWHRLTTSCIIFLVTVPQDNGRAKWMVGPIYLTLVRASTQLPIVFLHPWLLFISYAFSTLNILCLLWNVNSTVQSVAVLTVVLC